jgi:large conductance mechanosensitive channel
MVPNFLKEFKDFAMRGNVVDLSVGIIIGGAFGKIVSALVENIFMPPLGLIIGGVDFKDLTLQIKAATQNTPAVTIKYGLFIQAIVDFTIMAFAIFLLVRALHGFKRKDQTAVISEEVLLLREIRDNLKNSNEKK